ncbi:beta-lactamase family protein [Scytonema tolypothrichoides VB-61278]|nr:beta-lactamase family protein [Scytonema tolypothrichoides VB-61278]
MQGLSEFINKTIQEWKVPGLAIAIIKDSQIIFCEGFGLRDVENNLKVTQKTLFAVASCTKAFTTMAMGILADRGKLDWDKPVRNYLPTFKLYDSYATEHMTPRDLVTHRSGLPRHDFAWYGSVFTRQEIFERLQYLQPTQELRTTFQYQNLMYMTAGYLVGEIAQSSWEDFVQQEIFNPLGIKNSHFAVFKSQKSDDFAFPYKQKDEEVNKIPFRNMDTIGPAGSMNSNITDMAQWLLLHPKILYFPE